MNEDEKSYVEEQIKEKIDDYSSFTNKKVGDTPTDAIQLTPKKYVDTQISSVQSQISSVAASIPPVIDKQTFTSNGTWTKPSVISGKELVIVQLWGGGGGG
jgi:hypothetical protein